MMNMIKIYKSEEDAGLKDKITALTKASCSMGIDTDNKTKSASILSESTQEYMKKCISKDLMNLRGILVSTNWNKNDDVFAPADTWAARYTPMYKPANMNHVGSEQEGANQTIGVITRCEPVDDDYNYFEPDSEDKIANSNFNILVDMMLWEAYFPTAAKQIKAGIDDNKMFISMECLFSDFGYAIRAKDSNEVMFLNRNEITSWLSGSLRCYGGEGSCKINGQDYQIGRWLKGITFSGVGFVATPANEGSILFDDYISHAAKASFKVSDKQILNDFKGIGVLDFNKEMVTLWL